MAPPIAWGSPASARARWTARTFSGGTTVGSSSPVPRSARRAEVGWVVESGVQMSTWGTTTAAPAPRAGTVEVLVGLLAELDQATESGVFYDRVCQAVVTLTTMN